MGRNEAGKLWGKLETPHSRGEPGRSALAHLQTAPQRGPGDSVCSSLEAFSFAFGRANDENPVPPFGETLP